MIKKLLITLFVSTILISCVNDRDLSKNTVIAHITIQPDGLHPFNDNSTIRSYIFNYTQKTLIKLDIESLEYIPSLVKDMPTASADNLSFEYEIKEGVLWDDGTELNAKDVAFSVKLMLCPLTNNAQIRSNYTTVIKSIELDPSNSEAYKTAGEAYISELNELDSTVSALIETVPSKNRKLITTHESLGYLEARYGVEVLTTIIPSLSSADEISPAELVDVLDVIEDNDIKVIFVESEAPSVYAETIAAEANIKTVTGLWVETLRENQSYGDWLIENVELIVENLVDLP